MSDQFPVSFNQQFSSNVTHLINQEESLLKACVRNQMVVGKYDHFDRMGRGTVVERTSRHQATPQNDVAHSRRRVILKDYLWADMIDDADKLKSLIDPTSDYAKAAAMDFGIKIDSIIINAAVGNAASVDADDASSNISLPSTQKVDEDFGAGSDSNLTVEKIIEARVVLIKHSGSIRDKLTLAVNGSAVGSLLNDAKVGSADYNNARALVSGEIDTYLGFSFKVLKDGILTGAGTTDADPVLCVGFLQRSIGLSVAQDIKVSIDKLPTNCNSTQVLGTMSMAAVRIEEEGVVAIECVQA